MYNHDVGNRYEVSLSFLKDKMISPLEPLSTKLSSKLFTLSHLGYDEMPSSSLGPLTKTLKTSTKTQINFHTSQNKLLKNPNSRKDVEELDSWLKYMLSKQENEKNSADSIKNIFENTQIIYNACLKEIIRQISMDCSERGQFIQKIWDAYIALFERALIQNKRELEQKDLSSVEENSRIHKIYQYEIESLGNFIKSLSEEKEKLREQLASSRDRIKDLKRRLKTIQIDNRKLDNENEDIRKENEIALKTNLDLNFRIEQILNDNHSQDRSRTISPQNFQMKNTMFARKNPNNNNSPNKGPKEKISLFSDNGASVVGHLMYHKMGEIVNPMIKLENLQKVKDKFVEIDIEEPKLQSIFSMKQFMKHETLEKEKTLSDNKIPQEEQKNEVADLMSSEQSIVGREDKNVGTGNENFEQEFKEIGVNTENNSNGNFENNNEELQVVGLFIEDILKEIIQLSEEEKIEIKSKILKVIKLKAFSSAALSRKMTIFELENEDLKNKYRKLIIQCSEFELEKSLLAKQLKDQEKKFEEPFEWNTHFEDSNEPLTHHHPKKNMIFESFVKHFLKIDDENAYNIDENDLNRDEDDLNVEENNLTEDIKKKDSIIKANNELKKMQDHNARIEELQEESQESETSILKQKKARINSEGDIKEVKSKNDNKKRRNSEIIKKVRKSSFNIKKGKNIRKGNKKEDFNQSNQVTIEMKNNQNEINISNNNNEKQFSRNEKKNIIYKEQNERANNKKYFERTSDIQQQYRKDSLSANQEIINSHEKPHAERFSPNKETNSALQRIIFNNEINSSSYRKNKERIGFFNNEINSNSFIKSKEIGVVVNKEMKSKSYENPKAALAINKTNSEHYNSRSNLIFTLSLYFLNENYFCL